MKHALMLLLALPLAAGAAEPADLACDLERARAEVTASLLSRPTAFGTFGGAATSERNVTVGLSQSLSDLVRAGTIREAASARCSALAAEMLLDSQARWALLSVKRDAGTIELAAVDRALVTADANVNLLAGQLDARTITIGEYREAAGARTALELRRADLLRALAAPVPPTPTMDVPALIARAEEQEARSVALAERANAGNGWDVAVSGGVRQRLSGGGADPFVAVTARYSFGLGASRRAEADVRRVAAELAGAREDGRAGVAARELVEVRGLIDADEASVARATRELDELRRIRAPLSGIDTALALNAVRTLDLQIEALGATVVGASARLDGYRAVLKALE